MSSKIDAYSNPLTNPAYGAVKSPTSANASSSTAKLASPAAGDTVQLTGDAQKLHQLEKAIAAAPVVDVSRVQQVRQSLANGSYKVDSSIVAAKLSSMEWALGNS